MVQGRVGRSTHRRGGAYELASAKGEAPFGRSQEFTQRGRTSRQMDIFRYV